jgi:FKBP12-rapamycin complex-associated protein
MNELAINAPAVFISKINQEDTHVITSDIFFPVLGDPQPIVRVCAADALTEFLKVVMDRKHRSITGLLCNFYSNAMDGFQSDRVQINGHMHISNHNTMVRHDAIKHGSLLVLYTLLVVSRDFMRPRFLETCEAVLALKDHPHALIRLEILRMIPKLARLYPGPFSRRYVVASLQCLLHNASTTPHPRAKIDLRRTAYLALGELVLSLRDQGGTGFPGMTLFITPEREPFDGRSTIVYMTGESDIHLKMSSIFSILRSCLSGNKVTPFRTYGTVLSAVPEALHCCADLVEALGDRSLSFVDSILNDMFESGLSEDLLSSLHSISMSLPSKSASIEKRLLYEISLVLAGTVDIDDIVDPLYRRDGILRTDIGRGGRVQSLEGIGIKHEVVINASEQPDIVTKLVLALRRLGSFGGMRTVSLAFPIGYLLPFVQTVLCPYLYHPSEKVRKEAALTSCYLLNPGLHCDATLNIPTLGYTSSFLFEEILQKLLRVALSDPSPLVRRSIMQALDHRYDSYLCRFNHLSQLFLLLRDESLPVRINALRLIGRLAMLNPAPILAEARKLLMGLIKELTCNSDTGGGREAAIRVLIEFIKCTAFHRLLHPYLRSLIAALPLKGVPPRLAIGSLESLGELALVVKTAMNPWLHQLIPHTLEIMLDQSSTSKQRISLRALGQLAGGTGYVISPYFDYPSLLPLAVSVLPGTKRVPWSTRREVIRTLGILGALDPDHYHTTVTGARKGTGTGSGYFLEVEEEMESTLEKDKSRNLHDGSQSTMAVSHINTRSLTDDDDKEPAHLYMYEQYAMSALSTSKLAPARRLSPSDEDFYPTVAVQALTRILKDSSLAVHHGMVMQAVMYIFNSLGLRCVPFLPRIVPHILQTIRSCGQMALREALLQQITGLSNIVRDHLHPYSDVIFGVIEEFWTSRLLASVLSLVEKMAYVVPDDFRRFIPRLIPKYLAIIEAIKLQDLTNGQGTVGSYMVELERLELVFRSLRSLRGAMTEYIHLLIPALLKLSSALIHSSNHLTSGAMTNLTVNTVQTISSLLLVNDTSNTKRWSGLGSVVGASDNLPARAAQPLLRILSNEKYISRPVFDSLIECICICAIQMGKAQWIPLYHSTARSAISTWVRRASLASDSLMAKGENFATNRNVGNAEENRLQGNGLMLYDTIINELVSGVDGDIGSSNSLLSGYTTQNRPSLHSSTKDLLSFTLSPENFNENLESPPVINPLPNASSSKHRVNQLNLSRHWDITQRTSREDWDHWMRLFSVQLLREAPAPSLRATAGLAYAYQPLARELFPAAFICCWPELSEQYKASLTHALETAFTADVSPEILQTLLNLAEFMEHDSEDGGLPIDIAILGQLALKCRSYAKALHYKEREYNMRGGASCIQDIISVNKKLDLPGKFAVHTIC